MSLAVAMPAREKNSWGIREWVEMVLGMCWNFDWCWKFDRWKMINVEKGKGREETCSDAKSDGC